MTRVRQTRGALFAIGAMMVLLCIPPDSEAASGRTYRVHGQVMAVNVAKTPHMIAVKTPLTKHNDMTVGGQGDSPNQDCAKGEAGRAPDHRESEVVWLTYVKQRDGVFARTIQIQ